MYVCTLGSDLWINKAEMDFDVQCEVFCIDKKNVRELMYISLEHK